MSLLYKLSGLMMTALILAGYGVCISGIYFTSKSKCKDTAIGKTSTANSVIFLIVASIVLIFCHIIIWIPICTSCTEKKNAMERVTPNDDSTIGLKTQ